LLRIKLTKKAAPTWGGEFNREASNMAPEDQGHT